MDINTIRLIRNGLSNKEADIKKSQNTKQDKRDIARGCLKMADYMAF